MALFFYMAKKKLKLPKSDAGYVAMLDNFLKQALIMQEDEPDEGMTEIWDDFYLDNEIADSEDPYE